jgi:DNA polymerase-3 subunit alpha
VERTDGKRPEIDALALDDPETFAMLRSGQSIGVFQLEGGPMRSLMRALAPTGFDDIAALVALYRPGPMAANMHRDYADRKNGRQAVTYLHPDLEPILADTYGLMIYQESVMRVAQRIAGYTLEEADNLRKACGKKDRALIAAEREMFVAGCVAQGYTEQLGTKLFDIIEPFADYAFNKSHAYGYGLVAYQTAWLKAHHPVEYLAALLTSVRDDKDKTAVYLGECRILGIEVLVPDVNTSSAEFTPMVGTDGKRRIVFGLASVRNVGESLVERIVSERDSAGLFTDFYDFCRRVDPVVLNKRTVESLVKSGAFDSLGHPRQGLCLVFEEISDRVLERRREEEAGISTLFASIDGFSDAQSGSATGYGDVRVPIPDTEFTKPQRLAFEKEMLGLYVSDHPLRGLESTLSRMTDCSIADLKEDDGPAIGAMGRDGQVRSVGGVVTALSRRYTKRGELMATFVLEDLQASIEVFVFPKVMASVAMVLADDVICLVRGRVDVRDEQVKLVCMEAFRPELGLEGAGGLRVKLPVAALSDGVVDRLKQLFSEHQGAEPVFLEVGQTTLRLPPTFNVDSRRGLVGELRALLGPNAIVT